MPPSQSRPRPTISAGRETPLAGRGFTETKYGVSREGRDLVGFVGGGGIEVIVALTRQHPPETSGQEAYRGFVERLMKRDDAKANSFRGRHRMVLAPMPNPDGVEGGNWRLNAGGVDLNRDWGQFTQPETKALSDWIVQQAGDRRVVAMMDFHSTDKHRDLRAAAGMRLRPRSASCPHLKQAFDTALKAPPEWSYSHNASRRHVKRLGARSAESAWPHRRTLGSDLA